ncbi:MAG: rhomboid family intramembrane serine protease [Bryobacteraceae bacterium]
MEKRRMCPQCRAFISTDDRVCPYCESEVGPRRINRPSPGDVFGGFIPHAHFVTVMILLVNTALYIVMTLVSMQSREGGSIMSLDIRTLVEFGAKAPQEIFLGGQWWRLVMAGFLHGGMWHILFNSVALFDIGAAAEEAYGASRFVTIYIATTITGFLVSLFFSPAISIGSSAPIFGLIGAMIALGTRYRTAMGSMIRSLYMKWAIFGLVFAFLMPGVDNYAHIGGIAGGFVIGYAAGVPGLLDTAIEKFWRAACWVSLGVTAYAFIMMIVGIFAQSR